jgi:hypothetical protein
MEKQEDEIEKENQPHSGEVAQNGPAEGGSRDEPAHSIPVATTIRMTTRHSNCRCTGDEETSSQDSPRHDYTQRYRR